MLSIASLVTCYFQFLLHHSELALPPLHTCTTCITCTQHYPPAPLQGSVSGQPMVTQAFIEGPYGSASADIYGSRHDLFLLISGGIGVTPMQSVMNDLVSQQQRGREVKFLW